MGSLPSIVNANGKKTCNNKLVTILVNQELKDNITKIEKCQCATQNNHKVQPANVFQHFSRIQLTIILPVGPLSHVPLL